MIDNASALTATLTQGELYDCTEIALFAGANGFAYGADGRWEIIAARSCALVSGTTYTLRNLLRGRYGTEWAMSLHVAGDALILLDSGGDIEILAYRGVNLKPLSPIALTGNRDPSSNDWTLTWIRRTRTGGEWRDYVDADLGETSEAYADRRLRRWHLRHGQADDHHEHAGPAAYASADQVADFGANQATLYLKLYQMSSAIVGRGYPLTQSITR
jgi:hypothetical protein